MTKLTFRAMLLMAGILILAVFSVQAGVSSLSTEAVNHAAASVKGQPQDGGHYGIEPLFKDSAFRRFIKSGKRSLVALGRRLNLVVSSYAQAPSQIEKALNRKKKK